MPSHTEFDAVIVGSGPNGLSAAITLARAGRSVLLVEGHERVGGGVRSEETTLPGFVHDVCSAVYPLALASPFLRSLPLHEHGLQWVHPPLPMAHPFDDGSAVVLDRSLDLTAAALGVDGERYGRLMRPFVAAWQAFMGEVLAPIRIPPRRPLLLGRIGALGFWPASLFARAMFREERARGLFAGMAAHSIMALEKPLTTGYGLTLGLLGHAVGWPIAKGGAQSVAQALASYLRALGGRIETGRRIGNLDELPASKVTLLDVAPKSLLEIAGAKFPAGYRRSLGRYRYGPGAFKLDIAIDGPIPWRSQTCGSAGTVHVGGTLGEIAEAERAVAEGGHPERPFVLLAQQSLFDPSRAPQGKHTVWAYCHVPNGSQVDMSQAIIAQIERFAPGFSQRILALSARGPNWYEAYNPNYVGGDLVGGAQDLAQFFTRPTLRLAPYTTPLRGLYLCSSSTPPGGGVHGMCGFHAARAALRRELA